MEKWVDFFAPSFSSRKEAEEFVAHYEGMDLDNPLHPAKIMMHQTQRLITISDDLPKIRPGKESLQLLFLLVCAEHIAKLHDHYDGEGKSRAYVRYFFGNLLSTEQQDVLRTGITNWNRQPSTVKEAIDALYNVRCDVVHEGKYWGFHFNDGSTSMLNGEPDVIVNIRLVDLRALIVLGCIAAIRSYQNGPNKAN